MPALSRLILPDKQADVPSPPCSKRQHPKKNKRITLNLLLPLDSIYFSHKESGPLCAATVEKELIEN
jgi:hypothetical protein